MSPESIPQLSLGTAALIIFAVCAGFVMLRGMTRLLVGTIVLALSAWAGVRAWREAPALALEWTGSSPGWFNDGLPLVVFVVSFWLLRKIAKAVARPFGKKPGEDPRPRSMVKMAFALVLALIPAALIWLVGATVLHHTGSVAEVRAYSEKTSGLEESTPNDFERRLKASIEGAIPESWLNKLDPMTQPSRVTLAKLIAAQSDSPLRPVIDPRTGQPIPRAIIVDDPDLQNLAREGKFGKLLRHPLLTRALADPKVRQMLRETQL